MIRLAIENLADSHPESSRSGVRDDRGMHFAVTNACKVTRASSRSPGKYLLFPRSRKAASKRVSSQFSIFSDWMNITFDLRRARIHAQ